MTNVMEFSRDDLIVIYHQLGLSYDEILALLASHHSIVVSRRTLHRILRSHNLYRRVTSTDSSYLDVALPFVQRLLQHSGSMHGYRWFHARCVQENLLVSREDIRLILGILDPDGVSARRARRLRRREYYASGPNFIWHIDGYDKLKPYGLCVHGCIDGYSRYIIWMNVFRTNNNPDVVGSYYLSALEERMAAPRLIRGDRGTENTRIRTIQHMLLGEDSFIYGTSTANQRIESWWGILRRQCVQLWMDRFEALKDGGYFEGDIVDKALVQFCFTNVVQVRNIIIRVFVKCLTCSRVTLRMSHLMRGDNFSFDLYCI